MSLIEYQHLNTIGVLPRVIQEGLKLLGTVEIPGVDSSTAIDSWAAEVAHAGCEVDAYTDDRVPWCGLFAAVVALRAGKTPPQSPLWALNWSKFGTSVNRACLGDVLVFKRETGGHVGFYIAEDAGCYHVLGGNQSNSVSITRLRRARCVAIRRPLMKLPPTSVRPFLVTPSGHISENEV